MTVCLQHVEKVENTAEGLESVEVDEDFLSVTEQSETQAADQSEPPEAFGTKFLDGSAVVHFLSTAGAETFKDYANDVFLPYIKHQLENTERVDVVWDSYISKSLKEGTREKRGKGLRRKVADSNRLPGKWQDFLKDSNNKRELFAFLSEKVATANFQEEKTVVITSDKIVISRGGKVPDMPLNDHEEADTKIVLHLMNALKGGSSTCLVRTVDTDVVVILTGKLSKL